MVPGFQDPHLLWHAERAEDEETRLDIEYSKFYTVWMKITNKAVWVIMLVNKQLHRQI